MATIYRCDICKVLREDRKEIKPVTLPLLEVGHGGMNNPEALRPVFDHRDYIDNHEKDIEVCGTCWLRAMKALYTLPPKNSNE